MKTVFTLGLAAVLSCFSLLGCSDAQQLDQAQEDLSEERQETADAMREATQDGVVNEDEAEEINEEQGETAGAAGEVVEQEGELIEGRNN